MKKSIAAFVLALGCSTTLCAPAFADSRAIRGVGAAGSGMVLPDFRNTAGIGWISAADPIYAGGVSPANTGAQNTAAFQAAATAACAGGSNGRKVLYIPDTAHSGFGAYAVDTTSGIPIDIECSNVAVMAGGFGPVVLAPTGDTGNPTIKFGVGNNNSLANLIVNRSDNPTQTPNIVYSGTGVTFSGVASYGGFPDLDVASGTGLHSEGIMLSGNNSSTGSTLLRVHRSGSSATTPSENFFTDANIRASTSGGYAHAVVINASDGLNITASHPGFTNVTGENVLIQPQYTTDQITGVRITAGTLLDGGTYCLRELPLAGESGLIGNFRFDLACGGATGTAGISMEDPAMVNADFTGSQVYNGAATGMWLQAGRAYVLDGMSFRNNNTGNTAGLADLLLGATSTAPDTLEVTGNVFDTVGATHAVAYHIKVQGAADYIDIGSNTHRGAGTKDLFNNGGSGTNIHIARQLSDAAAPTITAGGGTGASVSGDNWSGSITVGSGTVTTITMTFSQNPTVVAPKCTVTGAGTGAAVLAVSNPGTNTLVISSATSFGGQHILYNCVQ